MITIITCNNFTLSSLFDQYFGYTTPTKTPSVNMRMTTKPAITIHYCSQCNWMLRATWMSQELLHSFSADLASVTLIPGTGGIFVIDIDGHVIWERKQDGGFPDAAELKRRVRDYCFPEKSLGHLEKKED
jgi:selenoprotein W-related protein